LSAYPLSWLLTTASRAVLGLRGVEEASHHELLTDDETRGLISTSEEHGEMGSDKVSMLQNLFVFETRTVEEIMVPRGKVAAIDLEDPWEDQDAVLSRIEHSRFPVTRGGDENVVGILSAKDLYGLIRSGNTHLAGTLESFVREPEGETT
jgi:CBS domain containing-hemolysin-like protein